MSTCASQLTDTGVGYVMQHVHVLLSWVFGVASNLVQLGHPFMGASLQQLQSCCIWCFVCEVPSGMYLP